MLPNLNHAMLHNQQQFTLTPLLQTGEMQSYCKAKKMQTGGGHSNVTKATQGHIKYSPILPVPSLQVSKRHSSPWDNRIFLSTLGITK